MIAFNRHLILLLSFSAFANISGLKAQTLDADILKGINPRSPNAQYWVKTSSSAYWVPGIVSFGSLAYGIFEKDKIVQRRAFETFINLGISTAITMALKTTINRMRPADKHPDAIFAHSATHGKSFPSGHTSLAFATATSVALDYKRWYIVVPAYLWAGSVGYSRLYLGEHYPSDVLGGAIVGIGSGYLSHWLSKKIFEDKYGRKFNVNIQE
jgi:membrane-associated phospholipid phosphatase